MLETSFGLGFFLKRNNSESKRGFVYLRITVDGIRKETSTKRKWEFSRWDQKSERAIGNKEGAGVINYFLDTLIIKINEYKNQVLQTKKHITSQKVMDYVLGNDTPRTKVLEEFEKHNSEMKALLGKGYAKGTLSRFSITFNHLKAFIKLKTDACDIEFTDLDLEFIKDFEFYLRTERNCSNNTTLKYIANFKKIIIRALDKDIITKDPFKNFKSRKTKIIKKPLTTQELYKPEHHLFSTERLNVVRDVFIFQCYTGLAYIDSYQLKKTDIKDGIDGLKWIMSERQKSGSTTNIPLLPQALAIIDKYKDHPLCQQRGTVLPVNSNQKMNEYLKEIANLCNFQFTLNTHMARRTFASTVTLKNNVPIHIVKEMLGHQSVKQTEAYAITEQITIGYEMSMLN
ncbi:site-specific integrase [Flavobacterium frigidarium]|jgi:integrase|uniref:Site-specific integrase n=1 Tax=Flavobacterium frigidarium TaxID=99286 RepID=A0ABV4KGJ4_9FLAO